MCGYFVRSFTYGCLIPPNSENPAFFCIAGFHCHTIIKTIQQIKSRIKEVKEDEYSNSLSKIQVCAMFRTGDIRRNVLLKFIRLCMETSCLCPSEGHKYGSQKLTKTTTQMIFFNQQRHMSSSLLEKACSRLLRAHKHLCEYLFSYKDHSYCKISAYKSLF